MEGIWSSYYVSLACLWNSYVLCTQYAHYRGKRKYSAVALCKVAEHANRVSKPCKNCSQHKHCDNITGLWRRALLLLFPPLTTNITLVWSVVVVVKSGGRNAEKRSVLVSIDWSFFFALLLLLQIILVVIKRIVRRSTRERRENKSSYFGSCSMVLHVTYLIALESTSTKRGKDFFHEHYRGMMQLGTCAILFPARIRIKVKKGTEQQ